MDDATKAIFLAGGIMIAVLVISISMYLLTGFREFNEANGLMLKGREITEFNSFFEKYPNNGTIKGFDVCSIYNKCYDINNDVDSLFSVRLYFSAGSLTDQLSEGSNGTGEIRRYFYFTDNYEEDFIYSYEYNGDGAISSVTISKS